MVHAIQWFDFANGRPLNDSDILVYIEKNSKYITEYVDSDFFIRKENLGYSKWATLINNNYYTCDICHDNLVVEVGENEYSTCPCVSDREAESRRLVKNTLDEILTLFHFQKTKDWEQKCIDTLLQFKNK
jgi:hypothetical protein